METQADSIAARANRILASILLAGGIMLIVPYLTFAVQKWTTMNLGGLFAVGLVIGQMSILMVLVIVPFFGAWVQRGSDRAAGKAFMISSLVRYLPIFILGFIHLILVTRNRWFVVPPFFGAALIVYAAALLSRDKRVRNP